MNYYLSLLVFIVSTITADCEINPALERVWSGKNGKKFIGIFARSFEQEGKKVQFINSSGKAVTVAFENLSDADQKIIIDFDRKTKAPSEKNSPDLSDYFKKLPVADRTKIPFLNANDFGGDNSEAMVDALWISLLWWDFTGILPIPKSGDLSRKAEWLHKELTRYIAQNGNSAASLSDGNECMLKYFEKRLNDTATCKITIHQNINSEVLTKITTGNNILVLKMSMIYSNSNVYSICSCLESLEPDGRFVIHMLGNRFTGKLRNILSPNPHQYSYEFILDHAAGLPDYYRNQEPKFFIGDNMWTGALAIEPLVYQTAGKKPPYTNTMHDH